MKTWLDEIDFCVFLALVMVLVIFLSAIAYGVYPMVY
jgi:hypothetical protein